MESTCQKGKAWCIHISAYAEPDKLLLQGDKIYAQLLPSLSEKPFTAVSTKRNKLKGSFAAVENIGPILFPLHSSIQSADVHVAEEPTLPEEPPYLKSLGLERTLKYPQKSKIFDDKLIPRTLTSAV